jgi:hypothetical protein
VATPLTKSHSLTTEKQQMILNALAKNTYKAINLNPKEPYE